MDILTFYITSIFIEDSCWCVEDSEEGKGRRRDYCLEREPPSISPRCTTFVLCYEFFLEFNHVSRLLELVTSNFIWLYGGLFTSLI